MGRLLIAGAATAAMCLILGIALADGPLLPKSVMGVYTLDATWQERIPDCLLTERRRLSLTVERDGAAYWELSASHQGSCRSASFIPTTCFSTGTADVFVSKGRVMFESNLTSRAAGAANLDTGTTEWKCGGVVLHMPDDWEPKAKCARVGRDEDYGWQDVADIACEDDSSWEEFAKATLGAPGGPLTIPIAPRRRVKLVRVAANPPPLVPAKPYNPFADVPPLQPDAGPRSYGAFDNFPVNPDAAPRTRPGPPADGCDGHVAERDEYLRSNMGWLRAYDHEAIITPSGRCHTTIEITIPGRNAEGCTMLVADALQGMRGALTQLWFTTIECRDQHNGSHEILL